MRRGVVEGREGGASRRIPRQEASRFLSVEDEARLRRNVEVRRARTEADDMDIFDDAVSDWGSVRNIATQMEGRGPAQQAQQQQWTGWQENV